MPVTLSEEKPVGKKKLKTPELSLPAGSLQCALYAFKGGADSVYFGMKAFSARAGAVNFSFEDLRKISRYCYENDKKFYITINTLLRDTDIPELLTLLKQINYTGCHGIIIQDMGVSEIIRENFPDLPLHASTQLAVYNEEGVKTLQKSGFSRIVLARELSFNEIKRIREACPDIEIKVFIHGAMCYGFSGLCMASEHLTGRSANCGSCAQICRTWFSLSDIRDIQDAENNSKNTSKNGKHSQKNPFSKSWCFSMDDLALGERILDYAKIGIDSFKIEGRMKGPEFTYSTARYYRAILNELNNPKDSLSNETALKGSASNETALNILKENAQIAFSRKTTEGFFSSENGSRNSVPMISPDYPSHRGIKIGTVKTTCQGKALVQFEKPAALRDGLLCISNGESAGFSLSFIESGLSFAGAGSKDVINFPTSSFKTKVEAGTPLYQTSRHNSTLPLLNENIPIYKRRADITVRITNEEVIISSEIFSRPCVKTFPVKAEEAKTQGGTIDVLSNVFSSSDKSYFTLRTLIFKNESSYDTPFIPISALKRIRREYYAELDAEFEKHTPEIRETENKAIYLRNTDKDFCVLHPLSLPEQNMDLNALFKEHNDIVLNNISQIAYAKRYPEKNYYLGHFLYAKNRYAYDYFKREIPSLCGIVLEDEKNVPLFISRVCFRHHALGLSCKNCSRNNTYSITQNNRKYAVYCKNCITEVYEK